MTKDEREAALVRRAADGDTEAFRTLFDTHNAPIFRFAYRLTSSVDVAEDIAQECFVRLIRSPAFDPERGSMRQFLYGIARNLVRQRQYAQGREVGWDDNAGEEPTVHIDPMEFAELATAVQAAILALPPLQREAIVLCEFEELSLDQAAEVVGAKVGALKARLHRAREGLRRSLAAYRSHVQLSMPKGTTL